MLKKVMITYFCLLVCFVLFLRKREKILEWSEKQREHIYVVPMLLEVMEEKKKKPPLRGP